MTLQNSYGANGVMTLFPFSFAIGSVDDLDVIIDGIEQSSGFIIRGAGGNDGGTVLFDAAPSNGSTVVLRHRGHISITPQDGACGHLADKLVAGDGIAFAIGTDGEGRQSLTVTAIGGTNTVSPDENLGDLTDPAEARANLDVYSTGQVDAAIAASSDLALKKAQNLADLPDKAAARANLGVYSTAQMDAAIADGTDSALKKAQNLADLSDKTVARTNLGVYSTAQVDAAIAQVDTTIIETSDLTEAVIQRLNVLERNVAINTLRDQIDAGWSVLKMVDGIADEFEDVTGTSNAESSGQNHNEIGNYITNTTDIEKVSLTGSSIVQSTNVTWWTSESAGKNGLFDGSLAAVPGFHTDSAGPGSVIVFDMGAPQQCLGFKIYASGIVYATWNIQYSSDNVTWATAYNGLVCSDGAGWKAASWAPAGAYRYWRIYKTDTASGGQYFAEVEWWAGGAVTDMTLTSAPFTALSSPSTARLILLHQAVNPTALNIDCTIEASRDGGVTWSAAPLINEGAFDASSSILSAIVDLSGQPAGTSMKWRFKTFNKTEQRLHGVWMQWS